jgi:nucleoside-diphosphate-sugar epimerase
MSPTPPFGRVLVTGAQGNLGRKLIAHLLTLPWCKAVIGIDRNAGVPTDRRVEPIAADLADPADGRWREAMGRADAVVHLAAQNPAPDAPWDDASSSYDMTLHVVGAAAQAGVKRLVFASSNHVMGRYKDPPLADGLVPGGLTTAHTPGPGTRWFDGRKLVQGSAYGVSKLMGERLCIALARLSDGSFSTVSVRIGWCQPGENLPQTINATGVVAEGVERADPDAARDLRWFRSMWLSNRDFTAVMERALVADSAGWDQPGIVVNGMSDNRGMAWSLKEGRRLIGYEPRDDIWAELG